MKIRRLRSALWFGLAILCLPLPIHAQGQGQEPTGFFPSHGFLLTGYGSANYTAVFTSGRTPNNFGASLSPIFLFQISDRVLFEAELEFALEEGGTATDLEYADLGYVLTNNLVVTAGKFLLPFNTFSERLHPTWINKSITHPPIYGHDVITGPTTPLLPILSDVGVQLRSSFDVGEYGYLTAVGFITQGPSVEAEAEAPGPPDGEASEVPEVVFGENFQDNNGNKMVGARAGFGIAPYFEVNLSAMTAKYDAASRLRFTGLGAHIEGRYHGLELHGEWIRTGQQVAQEASPSAVETLVRNGYFAQAAYRYNRFEPVLRWSQIYGGDLGGETVVPGGRQLALGISYWFEPALVLKAGYIINLENADHVDNNRLGIQWAFGF